MKVNKKSQLFIVSGLFILLAAIFIYSLETDNTYISDFGDNSILRNIISEMCLIGENSNSSNIVSRHNNFVLNIANYCNSFGNNCDLEYSYTAPGGNMSLLNYTHFIYNISYNWGMMNYEGSFVC